MVEANVVEERIRSGIPNVSLVQIEDLTGTRDHYRAVVVSSFFEGKTRIEQHQAVYRALGELMAGPVHALSLSTFTETAWASKPSEK
jgi:stress-induced morphogen